MSDPLPPFLRARIEQQREHAEQLAAIEEQDRQRRAAAIVRWKEIFIAASNLGHLAAERVAPSDQLFKLSTRERKRRLLYHTEEVRQDIANGWTIAAARHSDGMSAHNSDYATGYVDNYTGYGVLLTPEGQLINYETPNGGGNNLHDDQPNGDIRIVSHHIVTLSTGLNHFELTRDKVEHGLAVFAIRSGLA